MHQNHRASFHNWLSKNQNKKHALKPGFFVKIFSSEKSVATIEENYEKKLKACGTAKDDNLKKF